MEIVTISMEFLQNLGKTLHSLWSPFICGRKIIQSAPFNFLHCETFFPELNFPEGSPLQFFDVLRHNGC